DALVRGARLLDDLDVDLGLEQHPQAGADESVVVDDQHLRRHQSGDSSGTSATSVVPAPNADSIEMRPPTSATRSRMPTSPRPPSRVFAGSKPLPSSSITAD